jgi:hypothetical protein
LFEFVHDEVDDSHRLNVTGSIVLEPSHLRQMHERVPAKSVRRDAALIGNLLDEFHRILELLSVALPLEGRVEFLAVAYRDLHLAHGAPHTLAYSNVCRIDRTIAFVIPKLGISFFGYREAVGCYLERYPIDRQLYTRSLSMLT